jgi:hypothetical protein
LAGRHKAANLVEEFGGIGRHGRCHWKSARIFGGTRSMTVSRVSIVVPWRA